jgi:hypothetical protein
MTFSVISFAERIDTVLEYLDTVAFALPAIWEQKQEALTYEIDARG